VRKVNKKYYPILICILAVLFFFNFNIHLTHSSPAPNHKCSVCENNSFLENDNKPVQIFFKFLYAIISILILNNFYQIILSKKIRAPPMLSFRTK
jgi:hypothetical protein